MTKTAPPPNRRRTRAGEARLPVTVGLVLLFAAAGAALACALEIEPNDTPATATPLGTEHCFEGRVDGGDQDAFRWESSAADAATRWRIRIEAQGSGLLQVDVFRIAFAENLVDVTGVEALLTVGTVDGRTSVSAPFLVNEEDYTFGLSSSGGEISYRVTLERDDDLGSSHEAVAAEQVGAFAVLGGLAATERVPWTLSPGDARSRWRLDAQVALGTPLRLLLAHADGTFVARSEAQEVGRALLTDLALPAGEYVVVLDAGEAAGATFTLAATAEEEVDGDAEREPNDTWETANPLDPQRTMHGRTSRGDVDHFTFEVEGLLSEQIFDLAVATEGEVLVGLYDAEASLLQERRGRGVTLRSLRLAPGTYGLLVDGSEAAEYRVSFHPRGSPQPGQEEEPNDTPASAQRLDDSLTVRAELTGRDVDVFRFEVPAPGATYRVQILGREAGIERVEIGDADGRALHTHASGAGERSVRIDDVELAAGAYLLTVAGHDAEYAVRLLELGPVVEPPPVLEAASTGQAEPLVVTTLADDAPGAAALEVAPATVAPEGASEMLACEMPPDALAAGAAGAGTHRFASASALACGTVLNTVVEGDVVRLDDKASSFRYIWVAASERGTLIKIDTDTGEVLGEYWTSPVYDPARPSRDPSRTVVDRDGNAWVGNRSDGPDELGSVVKIGLLENGQCGDGSDDGTIVTSSGLGDVLPWTNDGDADRLGGVATADDDCILLHVRVAALGVRNLTVDPDGGIWVAGTGSRAFVKLDARTGEVLRSETSPCGGYGGLVDRAGVFWGARPLMRWVIDDEPLADGAQCAFHVPTYGLALDRHDRVWATDFGRKVCRLDAEGSVDVCFDAGEGDGLGDTRGVAVTDDDHVWIALSIGNAVTRFAPDGSVMARIGVGRTPTGVVTDAVGKVWVTNLTSSDVMRIDPLTNEVDLTVGLGGHGDPDERPLYWEARPYTYSDMTGALNFGPPESGTWTLQIPGPSFRTRWLGMRFEHQVPEGAGVRVRVVSADGGRTVRSGDPLELEGPVLTIEVTMSRAPDGSSPTFGGLEVDFEGIPLADGAIAVHARSDLVAASNAIAVILDASGSMGIMLPEGVSRWHAATAALLDLAERAFPRDVPLALRVYGHVEPTTCHTRLELPLTPFEPEEFRRVVTTLQPKLLSGTPLAESIAAVGEDLSGAEGRQMVVLVTDGEESCGGDPGAAIAALRQSGAVTVNIVGFALESEEVKRQFAEWAELGDGVYIDTAGGAELAAALEALLQPEFVVLDALGGEIGRGRVNLDMVAVPSGAYDVRVLSTPEKRIAGVRVMEQEVRVTVALRE